MFVFTVENISNIKGLTYTKDGISDKHLERIEYSKTSGLLKDFNYSEYMIKTPPKNNSIQTYEELKFLSYLPEDIEFVKKYDDAENVFEEVCKQNNVKYPADLVDSIVDASNGIILELKYHFNRPRPYQLAKHYNLDLGGITLESMKSPSFPSGHSTQGYLIGKILQTKLSIDTNAFLENTKNTSFSRNVGRAHYLSDSQVGEKLGNDMYQYLIKKI